MSCIERLDLAGCSGLTPALLTALLSSCPSLLDLDVSGCQDLAGGQHDDAVLDPLKAPPAADADAQGGAFPKLKFELASGMCESPMRLALLELPGAKPRLRRLAVGWGFDGIALRLMLEQSSDSLTALEASARGVSWHLPYGRWLTDHPSMI